MASTSSLRRSPQQRVAQEDEPVTSASTVTAVSAVSAATTATTTNIKKPKTVESSSYPSSTRNQGKVLSPPTKTLSQTSSTTSTNIQTIHQDTVRSFTSTANTPTGAAISSTRKGGENSYSSASGGGGETISNRNNNMSSGSDNNTSASTASTTSTALGNDSGNHGQSSTGSSITGNIRGSDAIMTTMNRDHDSTITGFTTQTTTSTGAVSAASSEGRNHIQSSSSSSSSSSATNSQTGITPPSSRIRASSSSTTTVDVDTTPSSTVEASSIASTSAIHLPHSSYPDSQTNNNHYPQFPYKYTHSQHQRQRQRQQQSVRNLFKVTSPYQIGLLSVAFTLLVSLCIMGIWRWKQRRSKWRDVHDINSLHKNGHGDNDDDQYENDPNVPTAKELKKLPQIGTVLEGVKSYPEISVKKSMSMHSPHSKSQEKRGGVGGGEDDNHEDTIDEEDGGYAPSEVSSMWDTTSQRWDNSYFHELERVSQANHLNHNNNDDDNNNNNNGNDKTNNGNSITLDFENAQQKAAISMVLRSLSHLSCGAPKGAAMDLYGMHNSSDDKNNNNNPVNGGNDTDVGESSIGENEAIEPHDVEFLEETDMEDSKAAPMIVLRRNDTTTSSV